MKRVFRLHRIFISQHLKRLMEYKVDFTVGAIGFLLGQAVEILFIGIIFHRFPTLPAGHLTRFCLFTVSVLFRKRLTICSLTTCG